MTVSGRRQAASSTLFLLLSFALHADYQAGLDAYAQGNFDRAFYEWMQVADSAEGEVHPEIMAETYYALGMLFWVGQGVQQNTSESALWLRKAAELNHPGAQVKLGYLYSSGEGVPRSDFEAMKWLMMAARQGDADAQYNLGVVYRDGLGVKADADKSLHWFREAAANGDAVSAGIVSEMESLAVAAQRAMPESRELTQPAAAEPERKTPTSSVPVKPQSPWWVDVHGLALDVQEEADSQAAGLPSQREDTGVAPPEPSPTSTLANESWLRSRDPERFTIQVIALLDVKKLQAFTGRHPDWSPFALYEQEWKGQPLWVLVQGDYPDVIRAREAAQRFPTDIQKRDKLWIRKFAMVQGLLE